MNRFDDLARVTARKVSATDRAGEECVTREKELLRREIQADAALGVSWSVQYLAGIIHKAYLEAVLCTPVGCGNFRRFGPKPSGLHIHHR